MKLKLLRHLEVDRAAVDGPPFLSAASGLAAIGDRLYVIGDDETHLAVFPADGNAPGRMLRLLSGSLPAEHKARKAAKPDFETLVLLPAPKTHPHGALLALGSGSTDIRRRGVVLPFDAQMKPCAPLVLDLSAIFAEIGKAVPETNIEGAVVRNGEIILFNRGNKSHPETTALAFNSTAFTEAALPVLRWRKPVALPEVDGVPLTITDACLLGDGSILVSTVAEDTSDAYNDGRLAGAAFAVLGPDLSLGRLEPIEPAIKIEGVQAWRDGERIQLLAVSDADDPAAPAGLYSGVF